MPQKSSTPRSHRCAQRTATTTRAPGWLVAASMRLALVGCSLVGQGSPAEPSNGTGAPTKALTVFTHDSFSLDDAVLDKFTKGAGYDVTFVAPGDAGALVNQLILTKTLRWATSSTGWITPSPAGR